MTHSTPCSNPTKTEPNPAPFLILASECTSYKETIKKAIQQHARHKKQSGGHGEGTDVHLDIKPQPRGSGFEFSQLISGGMVPHQYIPAVEAGVKEYCTEVLLGFPVVNLFDGQHHAVDSSDMAFRRAGIVAMKDTLPNCGPVLLEPICDVNIAIPNQYTSNAQSIITKRRGQILGFQAKESWTDWDEVEPIFRNRNSMISPSICARKPWGSAHSSGRSIIWRN